MITTGLRARWRLRPSTVASMLAACLMGACPAASAQAQGLTNEELAGQQMSVRELMHLDTRLALARLKDRLNEHGSPSSDSHAALSRQDGGPRLVAIYGVGKRLLAEVVVGTQTQVYMRGQALPVGAKAGASAYRLAGLSGSCVQLERQDESHTLCLHPGPWTQP